MARSYLENIAKSRFTEATLKRMYELVNRGKTDAAFQKLVYGIVGKKMPGEWKNYRGEIETVFNWFKANHDYRRDPFDVELVQDVWATMDRKRFDCDDASIWLGAACEILGAPARFVVVSTKPDREPEHVYVECFVGGSWLPLDASVQFSNAGWEPQDGVTHRKVWDRRSVGLGTSDDLPLEGLGMTRWEGGLADRMYQPVLVDGSLDPNAYTFAPHMPGAQVLSDRLIPSSAIAPVADQKPMAQPDDPALPYPGALPTASWFTPAERRTSTPGPLPMFLDPDAWTGEIPTMENDPSYYNPQPTVTEAHMVSDLAGLGVDVRRLRPEALHRIRDEYKRCHQECLRKKHAEMKALRAPAAARLSGHGDDYNLVGFGEATAVDAIAVMAKNILGIGEASTLDQAITLATQIYKEREAQKLAEAKARAEAEARARAAASGSGVLSAGMTPWVVPALVVGALIVAGKVMAR